VLYALDIPPYGGDTLWSNMYAAYDALSDGMKRLLDGLVALHSGHVYGVDGVPADLRHQPLDRDQPQQSEADIERGHPVIRVHPETGRKALFRQPDLYDALCGHDRGGEQAAARLSLLTMRRGPEFTCRFRWRKNALAVWDNRCAMHYAINGL